MNQHGTFDLNEWFILTTIVFGYLFFLLMPKRFSKRQTLTLFLMGIYFVSTFDHSISIYPFNFYNVNDTPVVDLWDILSFIMFGPFSYFFIYGYSMMKQNRFVCFLYILVWALFALLAEVVALWAGVYHYKNGYQAFYSLPVYLLVETLTMLYYYLFIKPEPSHSQRNRTLPDQKPSNAAEGPRK